MMGPKHRRDFLKQTTMSAVAIHSMGPVPLSEAAQLTAKSPEAYLCVTCGTQFTPSLQPPERCAICEDERQYVGPDGQQWATLALVRNQHKNRIKLEEANLYSINTEPRFGIGQRAFLIQTPQGNILWDCVALLDDATVAKIKELGGIKAIAISHPHYYTSMIEWSRAFDNAPIHIHETDSEWVMRPDPSVHFWQGETLALPGGTRLIKTGGHFEGYQVLHWPAGAERQGALMAGDQPQICMDSKQVSFMWSYPNYIPLNPPSIRHILGCLDQLDYDRVYGAFMLRGKGVIPSRGKELVRRSAERYLRAIQA